MTLPFTALANRDDNRKFNIEGRVISKIKREPLSNVQLLIRELNIWTFSDSDGVFKFESISQGEYTIDIITLGYSSETISLNIIKNITDIVVEMNEENLTIDEVV
nr:carboxypeptidase-like regulatory domain-containing protein [Bacteroidales bacterium]